MKVSLVFPPNRNIPSCPYSGLPLLAGCLEAAGHEVTCVDANLEVFDELVRPETVDRVHQQFQEAWGALRAKSELTLNEAYQLQALARLGVVPFEELRRASEAAKVLRTKEEFLEPERANWAYDLLASLCRVMYAINPVYHPLHENWLDDVFSYVESDFENPVQQIVESVVVDKILANDPELVGISIPFNEQTIEGFAILKAIKKRAPHVKTIIGGSIISAFHKRLCRDPRFYQYADYAMPGEADDAFPQLVTALEQGGDLTECANLYFRQDDGEVYEPMRRHMPNLNDLAAPDFSTIDVWRYYLPMPVINYQTSRGCYYGKCTFCSDDIKANFRFRKANLVVEDIEKMQAQTGVRHIMFWDPLTPPRLMRDIAKWNKERPEDERFYWAAETKFEKIFTDQAYCDLIHEGGARFLQFGYESGSQRVLDLMVKGNDLERVHLMLNAMRNADIAVSVQWFIGFPGATEDEDVRSWQYLNEHRDSVLLSSYMGVFSISPDDDIFRSGGDMYDIDLFQRDDGMWDFRHRDGDKHYDRSELDAAFLSRGDSESITRMGFYIYLTERPERVRELSNFERGGHFPTTWDEVESTRPVSPARNHVASFDFDVATSPEDQGVTADTNGSLSARETHLLLVTNSQRIYPIDEAERRMLELADGSRTAAELLAELPGDDAENRERLFRFVRHGVLVIPHVHSADDLRRVAAAS